MKFLGFLATGILALVTGGFILSGNGLTVNATLADQIFMGGALLFIGLGAVTLAVDSFYGYRTER